jgi:hypothetical protein
MVCRTSKLELVSAAAGQDEAEYMRRLWNSGAPMWMIADIVGRPVGFVAAALAAARGAP